MSKSYTAGVSLEGYTGTVLYNYSDEDMNGVTHTASLYVMNSESEWIQYEDEDSRWIIRLPYGSFKNNAISRYDGSS